MNYEGKFRDFMVGWLADQLKEPDANREEVENLYQEVVDADNDEVALARIEAVLGEAEAQKLWGLSNQWHDPIVDEAKDMIEALRQQVQEETNDPTQFYLFFLNPFEEGCVPSGFEDRLEQQICWMFRVFYSVVGEAVLVSEGWSPYVVVEPSYEDASNIIVLTYPQEDTFRKVFVYQDWYRAWHLHFDSLPELAEELLTLRRAIEQSATRVILEYRLIQTVAELMGEEYRP